MKRNLFKATIKSVTFIINSDKKSTKCIIRYYNPITNNDCKVIGTTICHPNDKYDKKLGKHIAESRAKLRMYKSLRDSVTIVCNHLEAKYRNLHTNEYLHFNELIYGNK